MDDSTYKAYKSANAERRSSNVFQTFVKTAAESASTGVKTATETGRFIIHLPRITENIHLDETQLKHKWAYNRFNKNKIFLFQFQKQR